MQGEQKYGPPAVVFTSACGFRLAKGDDFPFCSVSPGLVDIAECNCHNIGSEVGEIFSGEWMTAFPLSPPIFL